MEAFLISGYIIAYIMASYIRGLLLKNFNKSPLQLVAEEVDKGN
jgi:biotin transporter BioY